MFALIKRARQASRRPPLEDVIREVVRRSAEHVRDRLSPAAWNMSEAELRGYVRARGARPVRDAVERLACEQGWRAILSDSVIASALERTVYQVVYQMRMQPVVATSAVHATLRVAG